MNKQLRSILVFGIAVPLLIAASFFSCFGFAYVVCLLPFEGNNPPSDRSEVYKFFYGKPATQTTKQKVPEKFNSCFEKFSRPDGSIGFRKLNPTPAECNATLPEGWHDDGGPELVYDPTRKK